MNTKQTMTPDGKGVLITGCSSGIGRATALYLAGHGFTVFAAVRKKTDFEALVSLDLPGLVPIFPMDMRNLEQIRHAAEEIERELAARGKEGLYAIVNNAGGGSIAPIELMDLDNFRGELEARILGPVALAQALLPSLRRAKGRILWIATPALIPIPFVSDIHASDFAVNCIARTLHIELHASNIPGIFIRCGGVLTAAPQKSDRELVRALTRWPEDRLRHYRDALDRQRESLAAFDRKRSDPVLIAAKVFAALSAAKPKRVYRAGHMARAAALLELLPQPLVDLIMAGR
jgi:NAD(P)-dependent dehydrogenase (short-subunit alcohol dehydrogenase family)